MMMTEMESRIDWTRDGLRVCQLLTSTVSGEMKRHFGSFWVRSFLGNGTSLTEVEHRLTEELTRSLPDWLRATVEAQIEAYDLVQREVDGRALNFYRKRVGGADCMAGLPMLKMDGEEAPLVRLTALLGEDPDPIHATLNAVQGRVFCVAFSRRVENYPAATVVRVTKRTAAWRSGFHPPTPQE
jgi:hypothetical protein